MIVKATGMIFNVSLIGALACGAVTLVCAGDGKSVGWRAPDIDVLVAVDAPQAIVGCWVVDARGEARAVDLRTRGEARVNDAVVDSGTIVEVGHRIDHGVIVNDFAVPVTVLLTSGAWITLASTEGLYFGDDAMLGVTHRPACRCMCGDEAQTMERPSPPEDCKDIIGEYCEYGSVPLSSEYRQCVRTHIRVTPRTPSVTGETRDTK